MTHTPGPWIVTYGGFDKTQVTGPGQNVDLVVDIVAPPDQQVATAALIAAAPEMLAMLEAVLGSRNVRMELFERDLLRDIEELIQQAKGIGRGVCIACRKRVDVADKHAFPFPDQGGWACGECVKKQFGGASDDM
jgi:hypothetical protein